MLKKIKGEPITMINSKKINLLGIDLAKQIFQLHGVDCKGHTVLKKKIKRAELTPFIINLPICTIAMEACGGAHFWARTFKDFGHEVKLISPQFVKPFLKGNKNDANDAEAICEAAQRPSMRFVPVKNIANQDIQNLHRIRQRLVRNRTALSNEIRGLLSEYGIVIPKTIKKLKDLLIPILENHEEKRLSKLSRETFHNLLIELAQVEKDVEHYDKKLVEILKTNEQAQKIMDIDGVGIITATAIVAAVSDIHAFSSGRQFAAWIGLVPKQSSSGGKEKLGGISKRGDVYLRTLLIHGSRATLRYAGLRDDRRSKWIVDKIKSRGYNKTAVALANKNARTIWSILKNNTKYNCNFLNSTSINII